MTTLTTIHDLSPANYPPFPTKPDIRTTARAVLQDANGNIALMYVGNKGYHKLPGGGLEGNESIEQGLARELHEETGCTVQILKPLGRVEEYRGQGGFLQVSHGFLAKIIGEKGQPSFDAGEIAASFSLKWMPLPECLSLLVKEKGNPDYESHFINQREIAFLTAASALL